MLDAQLDELFSSVAAGPIPTGEAEGTAIVAPGTDFTPTIAKFINLFAWQGKVFDPEHGVLRNRITAFGLHAIIAIHMDRERRKQREIVEAIERHGPPPGWRS